MKTLIIYDNEGFIISQMSGDVREPAGIPFIRIEIPKGKRIISINPETDEPVFEDLPVPEIQQLKEQIDALNVAMAQMLGM